MFKTEEIRTEINDTTRGTAFNQITKHLARSPQVRVKPDPETHEESIQ